MGFMWSDFSLRTNHRLFTMTVALSISYSRCLIKMHSYVSLSSLDDTRISKSFQLTF